MPSAAGITALFQILLIGLVAGGKEPLTVPQPIKAHQEEVSKIQTLPFQELARPRRQLLQELVLAQPHLVHDMSRPEVQETARSTQAKTPSSSQANATQTTPLQDVALARTYQSALSTAEHTLDEVEAMERMVHLHPPLETQETQELHGAPDSPDPETEPRAGPGAADSSLEASGLYGGDTEDRERAEDGEERERRGGVEREEEDWEKRTGGEEGGDVGEADGMLRGVQLLEDLEEDNFTRPDLDAFIGYSPSFPQASPEAGPRQADLSSPGRQHHAGLEEIPAALVSEAMPVVRGEGEGQASGNGIFRNSVTIATTASSSSWRPVATEPMETETGTDFGLVGFAGSDNPRAEEEEIEAEEEEEEEEETGLSQLDVFTQNPTVPDVGVAPSRRPLQPAVETEEGVCVCVCLYYKVCSMWYPRWWIKESEDFRARLLPHTTDFSWDRLGLTTPPMAPGSEVRGGGVTELHLSEAHLDDLLEAQQVVCVDWRELAGRGYVFLNISHNMNCEEFRADQGVRLLDLLERVFARRLSSPEESWVLYLSKPNHHQPQLLMNVASEHGVITTKDVLQMLGEVRKSLIQLGVLEFGAASSCAVQPAASRGDYSKLLVVLLIIGSVCLLIISSGMGYICWQRRLLTTKTMTRAEELHFVENGCHDNPTLDVTNDSQPEMQEKKSSTNGLAGSREGGEVDSSRWQVFVNQAGCEEEEEEQDTHL
ncbi:unnamed protein product [Lota lota]